MRRILCIGDSNTFGYDPRSYFGGRYPSDVRWTGRLERSGWVVFDRGQNGASIPYGPPFPAIAALLRRCRPLHAVTVMLGSNDLLMGDRADAAAAKMDLFLRAVMEHAGQAKIVLIAPPPMQPGDWVQEERLLPDSRALSGRYQALAQSLGINFADAGQWDVSLTFDGVHFAPEGHAAFARHLSEYLEALFPQAGL